MVDWGYVAGYFDGEGCVTVPKPGAVNTRDCRLCWSNTNKESLEAIRDFIGCGVITSRCPGKPGYKIPYQLRISRSQDLQRIIPELISRCIIKREALERGLIFALTTRPIRDYGKLSKIGFAAVKAMYLDEGMSTGLIGKKLDVGTERVRRFLVERGVAMRTASESKLTSTVHGRSKLGIIPADVRRMYWEEELSIGQIAARFGCIRATIHGIMRHHDIPRRGPAESYAIRDRRRAERRNAALTTR